MAAKDLFNEWPERYEEWFATPIGKLVRQIEGELVMGFLEPGQGETILDVGCGTGVFTTDFLAAGARVIGVDISAPMLRFALRKTSGYPFAAVRGDVLSLPFKDNSFDKVTSITALEFVADARGAVNELFRVVRPGGRVVVATLNSLSPWATRRKAKTARGQRHILESAFFRSPEELLTCSPYKGIARTAIYFEKDEASDRALVIEKAGQAQNLNTGAFVAACWEKPH
ncbi:MAG: methyltransferase domain-containing protein [Chloroflexi bacterium]|nr:methyltransferase domain-containing protein [Chloroflexota bacterium]